MFSQNTDRRRRRVPANQHVLLVSYLMHEIRVNRLSGKSLKLLPPDIRLKGIKNLISAAASQAPLVISRYPLAGFRGPISNRVEGKERVGWEGKDAGHVRGVERGDRKWRGGEGSNGKGGKGRGGKGGRGGKRGGQEERSAAVLQCCQPM